VGPPDAGSFQLAVTTLKDFAALLGDSRRTHRGSVTMEVMA
jgi:hypothetical protein